ncbi:MAG: glycosyltransferase family 2 protein [Desulfobulbaceae bacterium]
MNKQVDVSIVVPLYNEEGNVQELYRELRSVLDRHSYTYEILFINDGSTDRTADLLKEMSSSDPHVVVVNFRRNFGQTAAMSAGFDYSRGDIVITMDGDLQNDPADIPKFLEKINEGHDVVAGWRYKRQDPFLNRRLPSMIANRIISWITGVKLHDYGCTLKAFRKDVAENIRLYGEMHRFIPAIASAIGISIAEVQVNHRPRQRGKSKYGISRTFRVILDLITVKFLLSYSHRPLHVFGLIGMLSFCLGTLISFVLILQRQIYDMPMADRPLLLLAILLVFIGIQFITFGLISELQIRTYHESQNKPIYYVKQVLGRESTS